MSDKLMIIDGNSLLFRAFYALPLLKTSDGTYTNAVYGFLTMLRRLLAEENPEYLLVAFDASRVSFRNQIYDQYKGTRGATPDELIGQFALIRQVLKAMNIAYLEMEGFEADDLIGTYSRLAEEHKMQAVIVTGDKDALQLVSDNTHVQLTRKGITEIDHYDPAALFDKYELQPAQIVDLKALMGDTSDNIPGVPGIGEKTALKLLKEYGTLDNIYAHLEDLGTSKMRRNLEENRDKAYLSHELATINRHVQVDEDLSCLQRQEPDREALIPMFERLQFKMFLADLALPSSESDNPAITAPPHQVDSVVLTDKGDVQILAAKLANCPSSVLLLESDNHHPMRANIVGIHLFADDKTYTIPFPELKDSLLTLQPWLESTACPKTTHDCKNARVLLLRHGIQLQGISNDSLLLAYVLNPGENAEELGTLIEKNLDKRCPAGNYASEASLLPDLVKALRSQAGDVLNRLHDEVELPVALILADMEFAGFRLDKAILTETSEELRVRIQEDEKTIYELAATTFNINSPQQLGKVLFEDLGLPVIKKTKTGYGTGAEVLEKLEDAHPIIPYILDYRVLSKLKSTYADSLSSLIDPASGRIHTIFKQAVTATGRLSSVDPNLQNIPIKMEEGRRLRRAFIAPGDDWLIFSADYSQIDLRCLAHISQDDILIDSFKRGIDIHTRTASEIFKVPLDQVSEHLRRRAKEVNFGIIYGISDFGLARQTGVGRKEAGQYIAAYLDSYPGVRKYMDDIVMFGQEHGYVETILGRRRYLPDLNSKNKMAQSFARRMALNTPIQGSSADIIKLAMIKYNELSGPLGLKSRLLLQVHDELVFEAHRGELKQLAGLVAESMVNAYPLAVPLTITMKTGPNWYEMSAYEA